jgi:hypothetical protein
VAVVVEPNPRRFQHLGDLLGQFGITGRRVLDGEQLVREAVEVVDGRGPGHGRDRGGVDVLVDYRDNYSDVI